MVIQCLTIVSTEFLHTSAIQVTSKPVQTKSEAVESKWLGLLMNMGDTPHPEDSYIPGASRERVKYIRDMLSKAVQAKRTQEGGDLMPNVIAKEVRHLYNELTAQSEKMAFFLVLEHDLGVDHSNILHLAENLVNVKDTGITAVLRAEDRLRQVLEPHYIQLLSHISRLEGGVKFIVDMRSDLQDGLTSETQLTARQELQALSTSIKHLLAQWFSVGLLDLQRVTWNSPCSVSEKVIRYEAVHPIQGWDDLKRRLAPDRRCYIFTHRSMPQEPIVVLHTALEYEISDNIQSILSEPEVDIDDCEYELENRTTAIFYSICSTQKGLAGVDLGNFLIKHVVRELQHEFPNITQYATLSPIPGFRAWLTLELKDAIENKDERALRPPLFRDKEMSGLLRMRSKGGTECAASVFKELIERDNWHKDQDIIDCIKAPLMRLGTRYLYEEKRRGFAFDQVANFHIRNGATMWRLNWMADTSARGLHNSLGLMVNYKYVLEDVDNNNQQYLLNGTIAASKPFLEILDSETPGNTARVE
ncbi:malonyl-CoA decarboxylase, mitochondrial isoform X2 [Nematostella vectensis]|uniref:malonyl-CoA decarboxylase, mitochondrial isoform X2 n=1 Tax=Nematostella vectensis TaxID=45351 RepID=UPI002076D76A|nr:malonyl-CoA decarboxylase, mitochondrial isoform X2 [Nematostella vectensis]